MNYILKNVDNRINYLIALRNFSEVKIHIQSKFEYYILLILAYLWNKNINKLNHPDKEYVINCCIKPSIGTLVSIARKLDVDKEIFSSAAFQRLQSNLDKYPQIRNEKVGHGFSYEDDHEKFVEILQDLINNIEACSFFLFKDDYDLVLVERVGEKAYIGVSYKPDGISYFPWFCSREIIDVKEGDLLILKENKYFRISPFIAIQDNNEFYLYSSVTERLTGAARFNRLIKTGILTKEVLEFNNLPVFADYYKRKTHNGTVINNFNNNYKKYIDVGIKKKIIKFLTENKSSVFATLWGHGGVGKTSSIQSLCDDLSVIEKKHFDYIIFISAKDRKYNYHKGVIEDITENVSSFEEIIKLINEVVYSEKKFDVSSIVNYDGKILLIIDDYETFSKEENEAIITFIKQLDINHHKIILTTRAATLITGEEIQTNELNESQTIDFLKEAIKIELPDYNLSQIAEKLKDPTITKKIFEITSGRPLFIFQFAILFGQKGTLNDTINHDIKSSKEAINFLYDRIYDYLSQSAKSMFLAISLLVNENDLASLLSKLEFILNMENKAIEFQSALNELLKLKIIEIPDKDIFKVYSVEIYGLMKRYYDKKGNEYDGDITNRFNLITADKKLSTDVALLNNADASRLMRSEVEVERLYKQIINRDSCIADIRLKAINNLATYFTSMRGKPEKALKLFDDYYHLFPKDPDFGLLYASYCWADASIERTRQAIKIIDDFLLSKTNLELEKNIEILGTLMMYKSISIINERELIKEKLRFKEITKKAYEKIFNEQYETMSAIYRFPGNKLFDLIKSSDIIQFKASTRRFAVDGLLHLVEITIRLQRWNTAFAICEYVRNNLPQQFHKPFISREYKIEQYSNGKYTAPLLIENPKTLLASKLKDALQKKEE